MRKAFIEALYQLALADDRIALLTGDLGFLVMEPFQEKFPQRFFNVGVAEQSMIGIATGMAEAGLRPYAYSIATFAALRPFEFIRNGPVRHRLPVRIVGVGSGFGYGHAGPTHHALEDVCVLRSLPGLTIVVPADANQAAAAVLATADHPGPIYFCLGKDDAAVVPGLDGRYELGRLQHLRAGADVAIVALGSLAADALAAADDLAARGVESAVAVVSSFHPDPTADLASLLARHRHVITVEAQAISGGLGAYVGGVIASHAIPCRLWPLAVRTSPDGRSGRERAMWQKHGLDRAGIVARALDALETGAQ